MPRKTAEERFWLSTEKSDGCWIWTGTKSSGYGVISVGGRPPRGRQVLAHRFSYELFNGPIPVRSDLHHGAVVMHTCDNRACVNPAHLRLGTQAENVADMDAKGRRRIGRMPAGSQHHQAKLTEADVVAIRCSTATHGELAQKYGVTPEAIQYARNGGWKHVRTQAARPASGKSLATRGAGNAASKLTDDVVRQIRASTAKPGVLAKQFGIVPDYVTLIRKRKVWKHVQ